MFDGTLRAGAAGARLRGGSWANLNDCTVRGKGPDACIVIEVWSVAVAYYLFAAPPVVTAAPPRDRPCDRFALPLPLCCRATRSLWPERCAGPSRILT